MGSYLFCKSYNTGVTMSSKITIVTVCYNAAGVIEKTIKSVLSQRTDYPCIEYIIVDGKSNDGTINFINKYASEIDVFISEPDEGIFDAMNKGVFHSSGDYVIFMNAGDTFFDESTISTFVNECTHKNNPDIIYGDHITDMRTTKYRSCAKPLTKIKYGMVFNHQSCMVKRSLLINSPFDINLLSADYNFLYQQYVDGKNFSYVSRPVAVYDAFGISAMQKARIYKEWMHSSLSKKFSVNVLFFFIAIRMKVYFDGMVKKNN